MKKPRKLKKQRKLKFKDLLRAKKMIVEDLLSGDGIKWTKKLLDATIKANGGKREFLRRIGPLLEEFKK